MQDILQGLQEYGLSDKESRVYLAVVELGVAPVSEISRRSKVNRTTCYSVLEDLIEMQFVQQIDHGNIEHYASAEPRSIARQAQMRAQTIKDIVPELKNLYRDADTKPRLRFYQGIPGIKEVYEGILQDKKLKSYSLISSESSWMRMDPSYFKKFLKRRAAKKIHTRLILEDSAEAREHQRRQKEYYGEVKILPKGSEKLFDSGVYIFPDKVIFIAQKKEFIAAEVHSRDIQKTLQFMFDFMWKHL